MAIQYKDTSWRIASTRHEQVGFTAERAGHYFEDEGPTPAPPKRPIRSQPPPPPERIRLISQVSAITRQNPCNVIRTRHRRRDELSPRCYGNASYAKKPPRREFPWGASEGEGGKESEGGREKNGGG